MVVILIADQNNLAKRISVSVLKVEVSSLDKFLSVYCRPVLKNGGNKKIVNEITR